MMSPPAGRNLKHRDRVDNGHGNERPVRREHGRLAPRPGQIDCTLRPARRGVEDAQPAEIGNRHSPAVARQCPVTKADVVLAVVVREAQRPVSMSQNRTSLMVTSRAAYFRLELNGVVVCPTDMIWRPSGVTATQNRLGLFEFAPATPCSFSIFRTSRPSDTAQTKSVAVW